MKTQQAIDFFKTKAKLAQALGIRVPSVYQWGEYPPDMRQLQIERLTGLKAEPGCRERVLGLTPEEQS